MQFQTIIIGSLYVMFKVIFIFVKFILIFKLILVTWSLFIIPEYKFESPPHFTSEL